MSREQFVIDTNVLVSGLLTTDSESPPARIVDGMLAARSPFLLSVDLLAEYRCVLLRKPIRRRHQLSEQEVDLILTEIAANGIVREPADVESIEPHADPGDRHLIRLLAVHPDSALVTGDRDLERA